MKLKTGQIIELPHKEHCKSNGEYIGRSLKFPKFLEIIAKGDVVGIDLRNEFLTIHQLEYIAWSLKQVASVEKFYFPKQIYPPDYMSRIMEFINKGVNLFEEIAKITRCNSELRQISSGQFEEQGIRKIVLEYVSLIQAPAEQFIPHECIRMNKKCVDLIELFADSDMLE